MCYGGSGDGAIDTPLLPSAGRGGGSISRADGGGRLPQPLRKDGFNKAPIDLRYVSGYI